MKKILMDSGLIIILLSSVLIIVGNNFMRKFKKPGVVSTQLHSAMAIETRLQVQIILQSDSLDKNYTNTFESGLMNRLKQTKISLAKQEKEVDNLRKKAMAEK